MPDKVVISDASTLIGLEHIDSLSLLKKLYTVVEITSIVRQEVGINLPDWLQTNDNFDEIIFRSLVPQLDEGEASSIALALANEDSLLIIDERKGRKVAKNLGLQITGLVGIIIRAKKEDFIPSGKAKLEELIKSGFRISQKIYSLALDQMEEN